MSRPNGAPPESGVITRDTPVGFELVGVKKAAVQRITATATGADVETGTLYFTGTRDILSL